MNKVKSIEVGNINSSNIENVGGKEESNAFELCCWMLFLMIFGFILGLIVGVSL